MRSVAHGLWRHLPASLRQSAYENLTSLAARCIVGEATADVRPQGGWEPPFVVAGPLSAPTGLGEGARLLARGLADLGLDVGIIDLGPALMQPKVVPLPDLPLAPRGPGTLLLAVQPPNVGYALLRIGHDRLAAKRRVGYWVWELDMLPPSWAGSNVLVHDVAAPSRFAAKALADGLCRPVQILSHPVAIGARRGGLRTDATMVFGAACDLGSTTARKNPFGVVEAYRRAFEAGAAVTLLFKVRGEASDSDAFARLRELARTSAPPIRLVVGDLASQELEGWWDEIDIFVTLHRSEGFGLLPAEAMARAIPVISTDWSATAEFVDPAVGWPVPARLVAARDTTGRYELPGAIWADPDLDAAATAMREAFRAGRAGLVARGQRAAARITDLFSLGRLESQLRCPASERVAPTLSGPFR